jgi:hypothetical protein
VRSLPLTQVSPSSEVGTPHPSFASWSPCPSPQEARSAEVSGGGGDGKPHRSHHTGHIAPVFLPGGAELREGPQTGVRYRAHMHPVLTQGHRAIFSWKKGW